MAIADVVEYAHLSDADLAALGVALEAVRRDIEDSRGEKDRAYIRRAHRLSAIPRRRRATRYRREQQQDRLGARNHRARRGQEHREHVRPPSTPGQRFDGRRAARDQRARLRASF